MAISKCVLSPNKLSTEDNGIFLPACSFPMMPSRELLLFQSFQDPDNNLLASFVNRLRDIVITYLSVYMLVLNL